MLNPSSPRPFSVYFQPLKPAIHQPVISIFVYIYIYILYIYNMYIQLYSSISIYIYTYIYIYICMFSPTGDSCVMMCPTEVSCQVVLGGSDPGLCLRQGSEPSGITSAGRERQPYVRPPSGVNVGQPGVWTRPHLGAGQRGPGPG